MSTKPSDLTPGQQHLLKEGIEVLAAMAYANSRAHGFWEDFYATCTVLADVDQPSISGGSKLQQKYLLDTKLHKIALIHSELGEMTEGVRKPHADEHCPEFTSEEVELADAVIRILDYAGAFDLRLAEAVLAKMEFNASRPYKHGKGA